jgi:hypothetical protein
MISREINRNSDPGTGDHQPSAAHQRAAARRPRPKPGEATHQHRAARPGPRAAGPAVQPGADLPDSAVAASRPTRTAAHPRNDLSGGVPGRSRRPDPQSLAVATHPSHLSQTPSQPRSTDPAMHRPLPQASTTGPPPPTTTAAHRSTFATRPARGGAAPTKTRTACSARTSPTAATSACTPPRT